jgi:serine/threonine protein kinase
MVDDHSDESFLKIVYSKVKTNGKTELVPLKLYYSDDSAEELNRAPFTTPETSQDQKLLLVNRYELQRVLGQGGFGRTYLTLDRHRFNEPCVVKEFIPQSQGDFETQKSRELFVREAKILHQIDHPQIPKFYACFEDDQKLFLVQEYVKGKTYYDLFRERQQQGQTFSEPEIIQWLKNLLPVLSYLHDRQIVHRDISLDNIMLHDDSHLPMLIDFGVGRSTLVQNKNKTEPINVLPSIVGKVGYSPYEQLWLGQSFPSSDLYALAVAAIALLTGFNPQSLSGQSSFKDYWQLQSPVSPGLVNILNRMLQDIPTNRYQSATEILADLEMLRTAPANNPRPPAASLPITTMPDASGTLQASQPIDRTVLTPEFIAHCAQELINYIGPIGQFLVQDTVTKQPHLSPAALIDLLMLQIPQPDQATKFQQQLRKNL